MYCTLTIFHHYQVFGSVEAVDQIEIEPTAEEGEVQLSSSLKDITSNAADAPELPSCNPSSPGLSNPHPDSENNALVTESAVTSTTSQQSAETSEVLKEKTPTESQAGGENVTDPEVKDKVPETEREAVSESKVDKDCDKSQETSEPDEKPEVEEKDATTNDQSGDLKAVDTNMNLRSVPEKTNVLKLETEIHNEYFQAPPLGQTLSFQAQKSKSDLEGAPPTAEKDANPQSETKPDITENPETTSEKSQMSTACTAESEQKDAGATVCDLAEIKKAAEIPFEKPGSNSPVRQVLNALQSASRGSLSLSSRQSPDTADSDDSPSALEMEDIPAGITCVNSEDIKARPLAGLAAPPVSFAQREKMASVDLVLDHHLDTACNTSPEGTDLGLSEEEPEMENVLTEPESAEAGGDTKHDESSEEQTYSVSMTHDIQTLI